jgi:hypothetical protein
MKQLRLTAASRRRIRTKLGKEILRLWANAAYSLNCADDCYYNDDKLGETLRYNEYVNDMKQAKALGIELKKFK